MPLEAWLESAMALPLIEIALDVTIRTPVSVSSPVCAVVRGLIGQRLRDLRCLHRDGEAPPSRYNRPMRPNVAQLLADVLALPAEQRRELVAEVLATLDDGPAEDPAVIAATSGEEIHRRIERRKPGLSKSSPWPEMRDTLLAELRARRGDPRR